MEAEILFPSYWESGGGEAEQNKQAKNKIFSQASVERGSVILILGRGHNGIPNMCVLPHNVIS